MFIVKLELHSDVDESDTLIKQYEWGRTHHLCLTHINSTVKIWHAGSSSLFSKQDKFSRLIK